MTIPKLCRCAEVLAVVVAQVVVADDGGRLDPGRDEKVDEDGLELEMAIALVFHPLRPYLCLIF